MPAGLCRIGSCCIAVLELLRAQAVQVRSLVALQLLQHRIHLRLGEGFIQRVAAGHASDRPLAVLVRCRRQLLTQEVFDVILPAQQGALHYLASWPAFDEPPELPRAAAE